MTNEDAIKWLENLTSDIGNPHYECLWHYAQALVEIAAMLKEQEPVTMKPYYFNYVCSGCRSEIDGEFIDYTGGKIKFCPYCGRKVMWNDD